MILTISGFSSYYCLVTHILSNGYKHDSIEPPIQGEYYLSAGAIILKSIEFPPNLFILLESLSAMFGNRVFPPTITIFSNNYFFISVSIKKYDLYTISSIPIHSLCINFGVKSTSGP